MNWDLVWTVVLLTWLFGSCVLLARLAVGVLSAWWTSRTGAPVTDPEWHAAISSAQTSLELDGKVRVVSSPWVGSPMTWGLVRPVLLLPEGALDWTPERRRAVALHELAHVKRRDCLIHILALTTRALHWTNPLAWIGVKRIRAERERACDDLVLMAGARNTDYAALLLDVARRRGDRRLDWAAVSMACPTELEGRLLAILDPARNRRGIGRFGSLASVVGIFGVALPLAAFQAVPSLGSAVTGDLADPVLLSDSPVPFVESKSPESASETAEREILPAPEMRGEVQSNRRNDNPGATRPSIVGPAPLTGIGVERASPQVVRDTLEAQYVAVMAQALQHPQADFRAEAAHTLGVIESPLAVPALIEVAGDESADVRRQVAWAFGMIESPDAVPALGPMIQDADADVRERAAWALGMIESSDGVSALLPALQDASEEVREQAAWALGMIESSEAVAALLPVLQDASEDVREQVAWALGMIESSDAVEGLVQALRTDAAVAVREQAAWALGMIEDPSAAEALAEAINDEDEDVARQAMSALARVLSR